MSWAYVSLDVYQEGMRAQSDGSTTRQITERVSERAIFQALASMMLPAFAIHSQVNLASKLFNRIGRFQRWGPTVCGFAMVPLLPYMFDEPVEHALGFVFKNYISEKPSDKKSE
jgi:fission process protein 1